MAHVNTDECEAAGLDPKEVLRIAKGISRYVLQANALGMFVFGSGEGDLRYTDQPRVAGDLKVAVLDGIIDGGAGDDHDWGDGLRRGESR